MEIEKFYTRNIDGFKLSRFTTQDSGIGRLLLTRRGRTATARSEFEVSVVVEESRAMEKIPGSGRRCRRGVESPHETLNDAPLFAAAPRSTQAGVHRMGL